MRRNIHYKPSKGACIFGGIIGCAMGIFGLFAIPDMDMGAQITDDTEDGAEGGKSDAEVRLAELQTLYDRRLITEEEYQEKRKEILDRL